LEKGKPPDKRIANSSNSGGYDKGDLDRETIIDQQVLDNHLIFVSFELKNSCRLI
jgi:hypothetical protein